MLFIFMLGPVILSATGALFSLTGGMGFVATAATVSEWQRRKGYKPGEGRFTERANDAYYGVRPDISSDYALSRDLGVLLAAVPRTLGKFGDKSFDFTHSEGEFLRALMVPVLNTLGDLQAAKELVEEQGSEEAVDLLHAVADQLAIVLAPVTGWLEQFPGTRIRKAYD